MSKTRVSLLIGTLLAAGMCLAQDTKMSTTATIATVNGVAYPLDIFRLFFMEQLQETQGQNDPAFQQQAINAFVTMVVAAQEAEKRKLQDAPEVTTALEVQRLKILSNAALASMVRDIRVTDDELNTAYGKLAISAGRTEYKARHILLKDEAEAINAIKELARGADFSELFKRMTDGSTGKSGGDLGWFNTDQIVKPLGDAVSKMTPGTYSKEPVQTPFGWHVINLQQTRTAEPPSFENAKPGLTSTVLRQRLDKELSTLRNGAAVELNKDLLKVGP